VQNNQKPHAAGKGQACTERNRSKNRHNPERLAEGKPKKDTLKQLQKSFQNREKLQKNSTKPTHKLFFCGSMPSAKTKGSSKMLPFLPLKRHS